MAELGPLSNQKSIFSVDEMKTLTQKRDNERNTRYRKIIPMMNTFLSMTQRIEKNPFFSPNFSFILINLYVYDYQQMGCDDYRLYSEAFESHVRNCKSWVIENLQRSPQYQKAYWQFVLIFAELMY